MTMGWLSGSIWRGGIVGKEANIEADEIFVGGDGNAFVSAVDTVHVVGFEKERAEAVDVVGERLVVVGIGAGED